MSRLPLFASSLAVLAFTLGLSGCGSATDSPPLQPAQQEPGGDAAGAEHEHAEHAEHEAHGEYEEALAQLSEADRALAEKQKICPVSGQPLGSMGKPYKITVKGREVLLCCQGCEAQITADPDKYLAKLK